MIRLASLLFAVLALIPAGAHLFSMNNKLRLGRTDYLVAQRAYDGWSLFAIVMIGALLSTLLLSLWLYRAAQPFKLTGSGVSLHL
jgi:hypothetical protein